MDSRPTGGVSKILIGTFMCRRCCCIGASLLPIPVSAISLVTGCKNSYKRKTLLYQITWKNRKHNIRYEIMSQLKKICEDSTYPIIFYLFFHLFNPFPDLLCHGRYASQGNHFYVCLFQGLLYSIHRVYGIVNFILKLFITQIKCTRLNSSNNKIKKNNFNIIQTLLFVGGASR